MATKAERLQEFATRLGAAVPARSFDEAYGQITRILNEVEDELSGVSYDMSKSATDGRLYPSLWDNVRAGPASRHGTPIQGPLDSDRPQRRH